MAVLEIEGMDDSDLPEGLYFAAADIQIREPQIFFKLSTPLGELGGRAMHRHLSVHNHYAAPWTVRGFQVVFNYTCRLGEGNAIEAVELGTDRVTKAHDQPAATKSALPATAATRRELEAALRILAEEWLAEHKAELAELAEQRRDLLRLRHLTLTQIHARLLSRLTASTHEPPDRFDAERVEKALAQVAALSPGELHFVVSKATEAALARAARAL